MRPAPNWSDSLEQVPSGTDDAVTRAVFVVLAMVLVGLSESEFELISNRFVTAYVSDVENSSS